jgi:hypothetical protein
MYKVKGHVPSNTIPLNARHSLWGALMHYLHPCSAATLFPRVYSPGHTYHVLAGPKVWSHGQVVVYVKYNYK